MSKLIRLFKSFYRLLLPVVAIIILGLIGASVWFVHSTAVVPSTTYLVTPEKYGWLSSRGAQVTEENWKNEDMTDARGWLLRGKEGMPAVILLHRYGADRSYVLNLGVKLNEATDFTILMPDLRGHGPNPLVPTTSFGGCEIQDTLAAVKFLKGLKNEEKDNLIGKEIGIYGVELGGLVALSAAAKEETIKTIVLDSVPAESSDVLEGAIESRFPFASSITAKMANGGSYLYYASGCFERKPLCETARAVSDRSVLLLAGMDAPALRDATSNLSACFPSKTNVKSFTDLKASGFDIGNASLETSEAYDQKIIYFFQSTLGMNDE